MMFIEKPRIPDKDDFRLLNVKPIPGTGIGSKKPRKSYKEVSKKYAAPRYRGPIDEDIVSISPEARRKMYEAISERQSFLPR